MKLDLIIKAHAFVFATLIANGVNSHQSDIAYWESDDCNKVSQAAGLYLYTSGELLKAAEKERKAERNNKPKALHKLEESEELHDLYEGVLFYSELSANATKNFQVFCKK
jgi:hypothetical protein